MAQKREDITLRGGRARKFREVKQSLEEELGYEVSRPRVIDELMENYDGPHW